MKYTRGFWIVKGFELLALFLVFGSARPPSLWWFGVGAGCVLLNLAGYAEGRGWPWRES